MENGECAKYASVRAFREVTPNRQRSSAYAISTREYPPPPISYLS